VLIDQIGEFGGPAGVLGCLLKFNALKRRITNSYAQYGARLRGIARGNLELEIFKNRAGGLTARPRGFS